MYLKELRRKNPSSQKTPRANKYKAVLLHPQQMMESSDDSNILDEETGTGTDLMSLQPKSYRERSVYNARDGCRKSSMISNNRISATKITI